MTLILALETTCDETAAAVVRDGRTVLSNIVASQVNLHARYGGVVPEIAARAHIETLNRLVEQALHQADVKPADLTAIAVANRPGLIGCLLVGVSAAKTLAFAWDKPLLCVNHVEAHLYGACLIGVAAPARPPWPPLPALGLVISGGHTNLYLVQAFAHMERIGATIDDAAGEAFDKAAAILGLGYPGGPLVDQLAGHGDPHAVKFPVSLLGRDSLNFSFSGLKTAVLYHVQGGAQAGAPGRAPLTRQEKADVAASFQHAVVQALCVKLRRAAERYPVQSFMIGGGVSANRRLRQAVEDLGAALKRPVYLPPPEFCTDNAAIIAGLATHLYRAGEIHPLDTAVVATV